jgi:hypothetical protein
MFKKVNRFININICTPNLEKSILNFLNYVSKIKPDNVFHPVNKKGISSKYSKNFKFYSL